MVGLIGCGAIVLAGLAVARSWRSGRHLALTTSPQAMLASKALSVRRSLLPPSASRAVSHSANIPVPLKQQISGLLANKIPSPAISSVSRQQAMQMYAALPLSFEKNQGQADAQVRFLARAPGYTLLLANQEAVVSLQQRKPPQAKQSAPNLTEAHPKTAHPKTIARNIRLKFAGASGASLVHGRDELPGKTNCFMGRDSKQWHSDLPTYAGVEYRGIYSGIDAVFHGNQQRLEYDFIVAPGADPRVIGLDVEGVAGMRIDSRGDLELRAGSSTLEFRKPIVYQEAAGQRRRINGNFARRGKHRVGFSIGPYDRSRPLIIDPTLVYSTYLGGSYADTGKAIAVDSSGDVYITGSVTSSDFPVSPGAFETTFPASTAAYVAKLNPAGTALVYATYFGDPYPGNTTTTGIAVDDSGDAYLTGYTDYDFPTTPGAFDTGGEYPYVTFAFATELNPAGTGLVYSTLLAGTESSGAHNTTGYGIAVDTGENAYVVGTTTSSTYPTTAGAYQTTQGCTSCFTGFVTKVNAGGESLSYSTYLGTGSNRPYAIALDSAGDAFIVGDTPTASFPVTPGAYLTAASEPEALFVTKLNPTGTALSYSTFLDEWSSASVDWPHAVAVDSSGYAYVTGTTPYAHFPTTPGAYQTNLLDNTDAFVTKLNPTGSALVYSTLLPGETDGYGIAVNSAGQAFVDGTSNAADLPTTPGAFQIAQPTTSTNGFLTVFSADGSSLAYSTYLGLAAQNDYSEMSYMYGIALDSSGDVYLVGTAPQGFPTTAGALKATLTPVTTGDGSQYPTNGIVMKFGFAGSATLTITPASLPAGMAGSEFSETLAATGGTGTVTFAVTSGSLPAGVTLTADGALSGTPTQAGTFPLTVTATDAGNDTGTQAYSLVIACQAITVGPAALAAGTSGTAYPEVTFTETGGIGTTTFAESGALPAGMSFAAPSLSGTPTESGSFPIQVTATDSNSCTGSVSDTLTINPATQTPAVVTDNETITVTDTETFPDVADSEKITVADIETVRAYAPIAITPSPTTFNTNSGTGYATHAFTPVQFTATGGTGALTFRESGALPAGITFSNGTLGGTPATSSAGNTYAFSVTATDAFGDSATLQGYALTIQAATAFPAVVTDNENITLTDTESFPDVADAEQITVTDIETVTAFNAIAITPSAADFNSSDGTGFAGAVYSPVTFTATGGRGALTLSESGTLPAGLTFKNGVLGGTLGSSSSGTYTFAVTATDANGDQATQQGYSLSVSAPLKPTLKISANPDSLTIAQGETGETTLTFTPSGGYTGKLALSCSGLPANSLCVFTQNGALVSSVALTGNNQPVNVQLTFVTDVNPQLARLETTSTPAPDRALLTAVAFWWPGSPVGLGFFVRKRVTPAKHLRWSRPWLVVLLAGTVTAGLAGCIANGPFITPAGTSKITVTAKPGSGAAQALSIILTITR